MTTALHEAPTGSQEDTVDGTASGNDADKGKLFDVPRAVIVLDDSDPTVLKLAFAGSIELDRNNPDDVKTYNDLKAGKTAELHVDAHIAGAKTTHHRDSDGNVDAVVQTKSLVIHSLNQA